jgi:hypothetical protein
MSDELPQITVEQWDDAMDDLANLASRLGYVEDRIVEWKERAEHYREALEKIAGHQFGNDWNTTAEFARMTLES